MKTDCLILGGGLAGSMAAWETTAAGLDTVVVEDGWGTSPWVHGFNVPVRPGDSPEVFLRDTLESGQGLSDPALAEALCGDALPLLRDLERRGLAFNREADGALQALRPLGASFPRVVSIGNETGTAVLDSLWERMAARVTRMRRSRALRLIKKEDRVCGALVFDRARETWTPVFARAVILATGGFCGIFPFTTNKRDSGGDGCAMAYEAGAELCDLEMIQFEPSGAVWPPALRGTSMITTLFYEGAVLRNQAGERFMLRYSPQGEQVGKDRLAQCIAREISAGGGTEHGGVWMDNTAVDPVLLWEKYPLYWQRYQEVGIDLSRQMIELAPAPHSALGGVRVDAAGRTAAAGLFACGEAEGGLHGANRLGGSGGLEPMVFGQRAGAAAAAYARSVEPVAETEIPFPEEGSHSIAETLAHMREEMGRALEAGVNVIRAEEGLARSEAAVAALMARAEFLQGADPGENFALLRLRNDLTTALLVIRSARERKETRGCHVREDYPETAPVPYRVITIRDAQGVPRTIREEIRT